MTTTDDELAFLRQTLGITTQAGTSVDLRAAFYKLMLTGALPFIPSDDLADGDTLVWDATGGRWEASSGPSYADSTPALYTWDYGSTLTPVALQAGYVSRYIRLGELVIYQFSMQANTVPADGGLVFDVPVAGGATGETGNLAVGYDNGTDDQFVIPLQLSGSGVTAGKLYGDNFDWSATATGPFVLSGTVMYQVPA